MNSNEYKQYIEIIMITELENSFLYFCQTDGEENYFKNALIYLCKNGEKGVTGPPKNTLSSFRIASSSLSGCKAKSFKLIFTFLFIIIPKEPFSPFVLHSLEKKYDETHAITSEIGVSSKPDIIQSILNKNFPDKFIVSFGYTGWSSGQLEKEIQQGSWIIIPANEQIIFSTKSDKRIEEASKLAGFNLNLVSSNYGKA